MNGHVPRVCVVGSLIMDLAVRVPRCPRPGETVLGTGLDEFLGGKGFNQAVAASRSGAATSLIGRVGADDWGARFGRCLRREGIDARRVLTDPHEGTGIGMPLVDDAGENAIVVVPRANGAVTAADVEAARPLIAAASVLLLQLELPLAAVLAAARLAREAGVLVVLNPAPAVADLEPFAGLVDVLVPNEGEAWRLSGRTDPAASLETVAADLHRRSGAAVIVTLGSAGAYLCSGSSGTRLDGHDVVAVDSVGAGDVFCGALGAMLARGAPLPDAASYANAAAAVAVTRRGAEPSIPTSGEVRALVSATTPT